MEVHSHTHTPLKKWTHYLWEFLMLFLAVFCGFLAENQREQMVEHHREKQYMISLAEDLKQDTSDIQKSISRAGKNLRYIDSAVLFLRNNSIQDKISAHFVDMIAAGLTRLQIIFTDRTSSQLKNSGGMRLIRDKKVADAIVNYWNQQQETQTTLERYLVYRDRGRQFDEGLISTSEFYLQSRGILKDSISFVAVINKDPALWAQFANIISHCGIVVPSHIKNLEKQFEMATQLIVLIGEKYHLTKNQ